MAGICCICRKTIGVGRVVEKQVVASFPLSHFGLCPTCLGRTRADISRIYGPATSAPAVAMATGSALAEKGSAA